MCRTGKQMHETALKQTFRASFNDAHPGNQVHHEPEPDYERHPLRLSSSEKKRFIERLSFLYGEDVAERYLPELERILKVYHAHKPPEMLEAEKGFDPSHRFTEKDVILITYGDLLHGEETSPLKPWQGFATPTWKGPSTPSIFYHSFPIHQTGVFPLSILRR